ncbi:MAG: right-handed parallel beta-helix repeat-containing protein, partial [Candidatus Thorarchaeota archaeon]
MTHRNHVLITFIFAILLVGIILPVGSLEGENENIVAQDTEPIVIESDDDLESQGWPGSGTDSDPYILEELYFENSVGPYISVSHISSSILISECQFVNASGEYWEEEFGIRLFNVSNVRIVNCTFAGWGKHIFVRNASLVQIVDSEFMRGDSIISEFVEEVEFHHNIWEECGIGDAIFVERLNFHSNQVNPSEYGSRFTSIDAGWVNVSWNCVSGDFRLHLNAENLVVMNNTFDGETHIHLSGSRTPNPVYHVVNNTLAAGGISFYDWLPFDFIMEQGDFSGNLVGNRPVLFLNNEDGTHIDPSEIAQLIAFGCTNIQISGSFVDTTNPIILARCTNTRIQDLSISDSRTGLSLYRCANTSIEDLNVQDSYYGISIIKTNLTTISRGQFSSLSGGIIIETCDNTTITDCIFTDLNYALQMYGTRYSLIYNNTFDASRENVI